MTRKLTAFLLALSCAVSLSEASAQTPAPAATPASGDLLPDAVAASCVRVVPTADDIFIYNDCGYRVAVATCVPRNARASLLCKTEGDDISTKTFFISPRGNITTGFPNGASIYQMACKAPAKPILASASSGKCVQP